LPEKPWREGVDVRKTIDKLSEFEFRALIPRMKTVLGAPQGLPSEKVPAYRQAGSAPDHLLQEDPASPTGEFAEQTSFITAPNVSYEELEKVGIAAWVLDSNITQPTVDDIYRIGKADSFEEAKKNILAEIKKRDLLFVYEKIEMPLYPVLRNMEKRGVKIDRAFLADLSKKYRTELDAIAKRIYDAAGEEFNINSPKQLGDILFDKLGLSVKNQKKTATGARSTRESELEKMRELHPIIGDILSFRELSKLLSTYIDTIPTLLDSEDRLHTSYVQTGTTTGRLASQNPNLQNIPIKTDLGRAIRHAFVPSDGMQLVSFDYSQIELRIAAFLSGDESLSDIFRSGRDVHREVAARVFHVQDADVSYEQRRRAKVINFGILYGMGVTSLQQALGTNRKEAQEFYDQYFEAFPRLAAYLDETKATAARQGYTETFFGRRRYFEGIKSSIPYVKAAAERMAINAPIQGTQADIVKLAMVEIAHWLHKEGLEEEIHMLLQVHDELVFEMKEGALQTHAPKIKQIMEQVVSEEERDGIPYKAEGKAGSNWGEMEEIAL
jgi:DNA polymerase-1